MDSRDRKLAWEREDQDQFRSPRKFLVRLCIFLLIYSLSYVLLFKSFGERVEYTEHTFQNHELIASHKMSTTELPFYPSETIQNIIYQVFCLAMNLDREEMELSREEKDRLQAMYDEHARVYCKSGFSWILSIEEDYIFGFENYYVLMGKEFYLDLETANDESSAL